MLPLLSFLHPPSLAANLRRPGGPPRQVTAFQYITFCVMAFKFQTMHNHVG